MMMKGRERQKKEKQALPNILAKELDSRVFGLAKSWPKVFNASNVAVPVIVNIKPIRNWVKIRFCLPNNRFEITEDNTNIHANEQTKTPTVMLELRMTPEAELGPCSVNANVVRAF